jgi:glyoxylase-like metal-dependent hydrolase (beta-lactamase superfamily II)
VRQILLLTFAFIVMTNVVHAHDSITPYSIEHYPLDQISKNIYVVHGPQEFISPKSRGFMNNPAAILTNNGVIVVDPGSSAEIGKQLLKKVREISDKPVIAVFNTHVHGDHWLGNYGIREIYPKVPIYAHERMIERVNAGEGEDFIRLIMGLTNGAIAGTEVVAPNFGLKGGENLILDNVKLKIHHTGHAHTDHDLMIEVIDDKALFFGDIVAANRVPNSDIPQDANYKGSITAIKTMLNNSQIEVFIPGHGRSGGRDVPEDFLRFLEKLLASVTKYYNQDFLDYEMKDQVVSDLEEYKDWNNFIEIGRVINSVYEEVEQDNF